MTDQDNYIQAAHDAGCPEDQIKRFISSGYVALKTMLPFHATARMVGNRTHGIREIMLDGTRGSAKSHAVIAQVGLDDCQTVPGLKCLFLRQTQRAASESFEDLIARVLRGVNHKANSERIVFDNGSRILIGGYSDENDINKYIGVEYDVLVVEESNQISGDKMDKLFGSLRTSKDNWVPRAYLTTNPGGLGHDYAKQRYIIPNRNSCETFTRRFFSSYSDNPFINPEYKEYLEGLTGTLAKIWRDGDWDVFAGQAFPEWNSDKHIVKPFDIPEHWQKWRGIDWGWAAPWSVHWFAKDPDSRRIYVYRELYKAGITDPQQARMINEMSLDETFAFTFADPSMWTKRTVTDVATSSYDTYLANGVYLTKADNDHANKLRKAHSVLALLPDGLPGLQSFSSNVNLNRVMPILLTDPDNPEDILDGQEEHAYDSLTYGLTNYRDPAPEPNRKPREPWRSPLASVKGL